MSQTRRSARLQDTASTTSTAHVRVDDNEQDDEAFMDVEDEGCVKKKTRGRKRKACEDGDTQAQTSHTQAKKARGRTRGILKDLVEMPWDVVSEIFGLLKPLDLLNLARTTKDLRAMLMSRSSVSIWKEARSQFPGMPECPPDLSEPQYADLVFGKHCHECLRNLSTYILWDARVRLCLKCLDLNSREKTYHYRFQRCPDELHRLVPTIRVNKKSGRHSRCKELMYLPLERLWEKQYKACAESEQYKWLNEMVKQRKAISAHGDACLTWFRTFLENCNLQKVSLIEGRRAIVVERLKKLGWGDELAKMSDEVQPQHTHTVTKACQKDLTERVLLNLEQYLITFMERSKAVRLARERKALLSLRLPVLNAVRNDWVASLPGNVVFPATCDLFLDPLVQDIISNIPATATFTKDDLQPVVDKFSEITLRWRQDIDSQLLTLITEAYGSHHSFDPQTVFDLATTFFSCNACTYSSKDVQHMRYPRVLIHACASTTSRNFGEQEGRDIDTDERIVADILSQGFWNRRRCISFVRDDLQLIGDVVEMCGFDRNTTTAQQMDVVNPIIECIACNDIHQGRATMTWAGVITHRYSHWHRESKKLMKLEVLNEKEAAIVRQQVAEIQERQRAQAHTRQMICTTCSQGGNSVELKKHVKTAHGKSTPTSDDIVPILDLNHVPPLYRLWPPREEEEPSAPQVATAVE
ncbi:hypothetical protein BDZ97DRAFT_1755332 [Flammula alnicola]|nr:hypothetical protein BDZ97DRAFT_1755332 [Flammula alnicola]